MIPRSLPAGRSRAGRHAVAGGVALLLLAGCGRDRPATGAPPARATTGRDTAAASVPPPPAAEVRAGGPRDSRPRIVFLGTSLTAGLGLDPDEAYPALVQAKLDSAGLAFQAVNAGVSGETSAGALRRLEWVLRDPAAVLVIETGANDGLRGQSPDSLAANLQAIIDRARARDPAPRLLLVGMEALPNLGADYVRRFRGVYPAVARRNGIPLLPFLLDGVAGVDTLNQADGIHPTAEGQRRIAAAVWAELRPLLP